MDLKGLRQVGRVEAEATNLYYEAKRELCAQDFWEFAKQCQTYDAKAKVIAPFPTDLKKWKYLDKVVSSLRPGQTTQIVKHRQLIMTWLLGGVFPNWQVFRALLYGEVWDGCATSKRIEDATETFRRFKYVHDNLPYWLKIGPKPKEDRKTAMDFGNGVSYRVFPATEEIGRNWTFSYVFMDEAAHTRYARAMWDSLAATLGDSSISVICDTRNGRFNWFGEQWFKPKTELSWNKVELHYYDHPDRDEQWHKREALKYPDPRVFMREHGDSWDVFSGKPVFETFNAARQAAGIEHFKPGNGVVVYRGWDFGYHYPYCCWAWIDQWDRLCFLRELMGKDINTDKFAERVIDISEAVFPGCVFRDFCDPAGNQVRPVDRVSAKDFVPAAKTDVEILAAVGKERGHPIYAKFVYGHIDPGIKAMRQKMMLRDDGMYGMLVDGNQCPILMGSLTGGYRYPEEEMPGENPEKDGYWDHSVDAARMVVVNLYGKPEPEKPGEKGVYIVSEMPIANRLQVDQGGPNIVRMVA
jgi:hypothetical protein